MATRRFEVSDAEALEFKSALFCLVSLVKEKSRTTAGQLSEVMSLNVRLLVYLMLQCHEHGPVALTTLTSKRWLAFASCLNDVSALSLTREAASALRICYDVLKKPFIDPLQAVFPDFSMHRAPLCRPSAAGVADLAQEFSHPDVCIDLIFGIIYRMFRDSVTPREDAEAECFWACVRGRGL